MVSLFLLSLITAFTFIWIPTSTWGALTFQNPRGGAHLLRGGFFRGGPSRQKNDLPEASASEEEDSSDEEDDSSDDNEDHSKEGNDPATEMNNYIRFCKSSLDLYPNKKIHLQSPAGGESQYPANLNCEWEIMGTPECVPTLTCKSLDLREDCDTEYLRVFDGMGGEIRLCGDELSHGRVDKVFVGRFGYYLYVEFRTDEHDDFDRLYTGFDCEVRCHYEHKTKPVFLPVTDPPKDEFTCVCGKQFDEGHLKIVSGTNAIKNEFPWQVALVMPSTRKPFCGGSLINNLFIMSAAHCCVGKMPTELDVIVRAHAVDRSFIDPEEEDGLKTVATKDEFRAQVAEIIIHDWYNKYSLADSDICLLKLSKPIHFKDPNSPVPVCLPQINVSNPDYTGMNATVAGWGLLEEMGTASSSILQKLQVPILPLHKCERWYERSGVTLSENMICAGYKEGGMDACQGDSGGPLITSERSSSVQIGVVSFGEGCARKKRPGLYVKVSSNA